MTNHTQSLGIALWNLSLMRSDQSQEIESISRASDIMLYKDVSNQSQEIDFLRRDWTPMSESIIKWNLPSKGKSEMSLIVYNYSLLNVVYNLFSTQDTYDNKVTSLSLDWYTTFVENHTKELSRNEMAEIIEGVHNLMRTNNFKLLNNILKSTLDNSSSVESITCLLRSSFSVKHKLSNWSKLLKNAITWLESKGESPKEILIGLY